MDMLVPILRLFSEKTYYLSSHMELFVMNLLRKASFSYSCAVP